MSDEHKPEEYSSPTAEEAVYDEASREEIDEYIERLEPWLKNQRAGSNDKRSWSHGGSWIELAVSAMVQAVGVLLGVGDDVITVLGSQISPRKVQWLWPNRIPLGKLTLFVGNPDNGKSLVGLDVAAVVSAGGKWFDAERIVDPGDVLIFASEDDPADTIVPRLMAAGADLSRIRFGTVVSDDPNLTQKEREMQLDKDIEAIKKHVTANPNIRLIIIDPLSNYLGATKMIEEQAVRQVFTPLQRLASEAAVAVLGIMHLNKKQDLNAINRIGGAMAFVGVARTVWVFGADGEAPNTFHMLRVKNNLGDRSGGLKYEISPRPVAIEGEDVPVPHIKWVGQSDKSADKLLAPPRPAGRPPEQRKEATEWLEFFLRDGAKLSTEVENQGEVAGLSLRTLERAKERQGCKTAISPRCQATFELAQSAQPVRRVHWGVSHTMRFGARLGVSMYSRSWNPEASIPIPGATTRHLIICSR